LYLRQANIGINDFVTVTSTINEIIEFRRRIIKGIIKVVELKRIKEKEIIATTPKT
jgi:hypothetical protein